MFLSEFIFLVLRKHSDIFLIWEHISQIKKIFLNKFGGIYSVEESDDLLEGRLKRSILHLQFIVSHRMVWKISYCFELTHDFIFYFDFWNERLPLLNAAFW